MFEIESKNQDEIIISTKSTTLKFNIADAVIDAGLAVGKITGPGEFEIGEATIRGIATESGKTIYDVEIGGVHTGILGGIEEGLLTATTPVPALFGTDDFIGRLWRSDAVCLSLTGFFSPTSMVFLSENLSLFS